MQKVKAKKSLGQHFLTDRNIAKKIVDSLKQDNCKTIVEIGPGTGVLTKMLLQSTKPFFAIEIDQESIDFLKNEFPEKNFLVEGDVLKIDFSQFDAPLAIIGNFPYYISSQIFFKALENKNAVNELVCMIQKEVAQRIASPPGNKTYGILSVLLQTYFDIEYLFTVHEHCFSPAPKVKSAVIRLKRNNRENLNCDEKLFFRVVKQSFNQRRKTLRNSLKNICLNLDGQSEMLAKRPEQLSVDEFIELTAAIETSNQKTM
ncbi:MAG: 16S rRNA (adenine(1518)-N(6)/adenine(1519)-N(6))-dimethyltransferase RsmA [Bacteroidales bacterium]|nr:16S rRNA (adenine(1518)-N(6)/adenine(1519)-N(6))-dimethyltransferase RsmA [Bacteroidales bacterium]MBN2819252.1 16S rRNA (adenine(1518)-N(6)/adenine(1519)-N(6))-dimethyltransferase RsmA [Bacteroidales bacterium]